MPIVKYYTAQGCLAQGIAVTDVYQEKILTSSLALNYDGEWVYIKTAREIIHTSS